MRQKLNTTKEKKDMKQRKACIKRCIACLLCVFLLCPGILAYAEEYEYDDLNRVTKVIYDDGSYVEYTYDRNGNIIKTKVYNAGETGDESTENETTRDNENTSDIETGEESTSKEEITEEITEGKTNEEETTIKNQDNNEEETTIKNQDNNEESKHELSEEDIRQIEEIYIWFTDVKNAILNKLRRVFIGIPEKILQLLGIL